MATTGLLDHEGTRSERRPNDEMLAHTARMIQGEYLEMPGCR